jgi:hypothetical protein
MTLPTARVVRPASVMSGAEEKVATGGELTLFEAVDRLAVHAAREFEAPSSSWQVLTQGLSGRGRSKGGRVLGVVGDGVGSFY